MTLLELQIALGTDEFRQKMGADYHLIQSLTDRTLSSDCTRCAWRAHAASIATILAKYGYTLDGKTSPALKEQAKEVPVPKEVLKKERFTRTPCLDCVKKHINQAFILQSEWRCGYKGYFGLILAHLEEAYEECPPELGTLRDYLLRFIKDSELSGVPLVPRELLLGQIPLKYEPVGHTEPEEVTPETYEVTGSLFDLDTLDTYEKMELKRLLEKANQAATVDNWEGYLAVAGDMIAAKAPYSANILRNRRLLYRGYPQGLQDPALPYAGNKDFLDKLKIG